MPILIVKDADLVRHILVKDFEYLVDRNGGGFKNFMETGVRTDEIWNKQMTNASGEEWKNIRSTFTPIFTAGKMKAMLIFMQESCKQLLNGIDEYAENKEPFELKEMLGKYSMDTIASCAFGVNAESFTNKKSKFVEYAGNIFKQRLSSMLRIVLAMIPGGLKIMKTFKISVMPFIQETEFFYQAILSSLNHRRENKTRRNDLVDLMLDAIKGDMDHEVEEEEEQFEKVFSFFSSSYMTFNYSYTPFFNFILKDAKLNHHSKKTFDELIIVATAIVLLVAGYDTTGTTLAWALYELSKNPEIQDRLRDEVEAITDGDMEKDLSYDNLQCMTYLDQVICETLRFHNPIAILQRATSKDYTIPGTDLIVPKDNSVWINILAIHFNPKHYSDPHVFNPDHFSKEEKAKRNP